MLFVDPQDSTPVYKQIVSRIEKGIREGKLRPGAAVPSMNALAAEADISRETVKKAYGILRDRGLLAPRQGKGFYVAEPSASRPMQVLVLFDKLSVYKQILFASLAETLGHRAEITILTHDQNLDLFAFLLDSNLDRYDYYVVAPHFPLDAASQQRALKQLRRIPNRKLILVDHWLRDLLGNYGAVYQDFANDACEGLASALRKLRTCTEVKVVTLPQSLYGREIGAGIGRFCSANGIPLRFFDAVPAEMTRGDVFILLNSQLDSALVELARAARERRFKIGRDIFVISYNEFPLNEVVLGGLTTLSADFAAMGRRAAEMILSGVPAKERCPFRLTRRSTF